MTPDQAGEWIHTLSDALGCPRPNHRLEHAPDQPRHKQYAGGYDAETMTIVSVAFAASDPSPVGQLTLLRQFSKHLHHMKAHTGDDLTCCSNEVGETARRLCLFDGERS